jgi:hypothetical protein
LPFLFHPIVWAQTPNPTCSFTSGGNTYNGVCVLSHAYDNDRGNLNSVEPIITATNIVSGLTATASIDLSGAVFAQPLYVQDLTVGSYAVQNVVLVATEENYVYALDGSTLALINRWTNNPVNLNGTSEAAIPDSDLPTGCTDIKPEVGITGTPALDLQGNSSGFLAGILYVVTAVKQGTGMSATYTQRLTGINILTGTILVPAIDIPAAIASAGNLAPFDPRVQNQRAGLALSHDTNGDPLIYVSWGSHCDATFSGYNYSGRVAVFEVNGGTSPASFQLLDVFDDEAGSTATTPRGGI